VALTFGLPQTLGGKYRLSDYIKGAEEKEGWISAVAFVPACWVLMYSFTKELHY